MKVGDEVSCWELNRRGVPQGSVLGPLCFNVFLNDLSYFISRVSLNAYADDQQLYGADSDGGSKTQVTGQVRSQVIGQVRSGQ